MITNENIGHVVTLWGHEELGSVTILEVLASTSRDATFARVRFEDGTDGLFSAMDLRVPEKPARRIVLRGRFGRRDQVFQNYSETLRWLAANNQQHGQTVNVQHFCIGSWRRGRNEGDAPILDPHGLYWANQQLWTSNLTQEQFERLAVLSRRYSSYRTHLVEVAPEWRTVATVPYMDNSVEEEQVDKWGNRRTVMVTAPHGDACF